jgi:hypothetical protein
VHISQFQERIFGDCIRVIYNPAPVPSKSAAKFATLDVQVQVKFYSVKEL